MSARDKNYKRTLGVDQLAFLLENCNVAQIETFEDGSASIRYNLSPNEAMKEIFISEYNWSKLKEKYPKLI